MTDGSATFTYQGPGDDGTFEDPVSEVRFLARDTSQDQWSLTDQEIAYYLTLTGSTLGAAARTADARAAKYASTAKKLISVGPFKVEEDYENAAADMRALAESLRSGAAAGSPVADFLGDTDAAWCPPVFGLYMTDYPGIGYTERAGY